jgi:glutamate synthase domain-containing protein 2
MTHGFKRASFRMKNGKVAAYTKGIIKEVETIAHSVGVSEPRKMRRDHVRIVQPDTTSILLSTLYPS